MQTDLKFSAITGSVQRLGVFARCDGAAIANAFTAFLSIFDQTAQVAAGHTSKVTKNVSIPAAGTWYTLYALVRANGAFAVWFFPRNSAPGLPVLVSQQDVFATGGAQATGRVGLYDFNGSAAATRNYDNLRVSVPTADAVLHPSQSAELRWDGMYREDSTGIAYGPVSHVVGDLPRLPPTVEGGTTEVFLKLSRGDFDQLPDDGIDDVSARVTYRPCWLTVPGS